MNAPAPQTLGRYELVSLLGRGGHGEVWRARKVGPLGFSAEVAIKVLSATGSGEQLQREARLGALLRHPNVVAVHGLEQIDGRWVMEMELVEGCSLRQVIKRRRSLSPRALISLGRQVLEGLAHIHDLEVDGERVGMVHRDIKPGNLLIDGAGTVRIADLGVACLAQTHTAAGTIGYASPEQLRGDPIDGRADLFSLGSVLVRACGQRSLVGRGDVGMIRTLALDADRVAAWVAPVDQVLPGLADVLTPWLDPDPDQRPEDAWKAMHEWSRLDARNSKGLSLAQSARDDETDESPAASLQETPDVAPTRRPPADHVVVGRDALLRQAEAAWVEGPLLLVGPGGIGKSHVAKALVGPRVSMSVWIDLSHARSVAEVRSALARAFGMQAAPTPETMAARALTASLGLRRWVVLDTLEQLTEEAEVWLDAWVDAVAPVISVLGTTRRGRPGTMWGSVPVGPLSQEAATELYRLYCPVASPSDAEAIDTVVRALEGVPLAIELAARTRTGSDPAVAMRARHRSLDACLEVSWSLLRPEARAALTALSVFEGPVDRHGAQAVVRSSGPVVPLVQELADASLVEGFGSGAVHLLDLVRRFVRRRAPAGALALAEQRHADWFVQLARTARPAHLPDLVVACRRARAAGRPGVAVGCALGAWKVLEAQGPPELAVELLQPLLDHVYGPERPELVAALSCALAACGRLQEGLDWLDRELADDPDPAVRALYQERRGGRLFDLGRLPEARTCLEEAVSLYQQLSDARGEADSMGALGVALHRCGEVEAAEACYKTAIRLQDAVGNTTRKAASLTNLGSLRLEQGDRRARGLLEEAVRLYRQDGSRRLECVALVSLALLLGRDGQLDPARRVLVRCVRLAERVGATRTLAIAQNNLGMLLHAQGDPAAGRTFEGALAAVARCRDPRSEAHIHRAWGHWAFESGDPVTGRRHLDRALRMAEEHDVDALAPLVRALLAWLELSEGDPQTARALLEAADAEMVGSKRADVLLHIELVWCAWHWSTGNTAGGDVRFDEASVGLQRLGCRENSLLERAARRLRVRFRS